MTQPYLSVIVVSWNSRDELPECLICLTRAAKRLNRKTQVILVDNASSDGSADMTEKMYPWVQIVRMPTNVGFPRACNVGLEETGGEHVLIINPDVRIESDSLAKCATVLESEPSVGLMSSPDWPMTPAALTRKQRGGFPRCGGYYAKPSSFTASFRTPERSVG